MRSSFRVLDNITPWLVCLRRSSAESVEFQVTDLRVFYCCAYSGADIHAQLEAAAISSPIEAMLDLLQKNFDAGGTYGAKLCVRPPVGLNEPLRLEWRHQAGYNLLCFSCDRAADSATCLRDELVLPLMRASEQLERLVPADIEWHPPDGPLPLPSFEAPLLGQMLAHAHDSRGSAALPACESTAGDEQSAKVSADGASHVLAPVADETEAKRKRAQAAREEKASKQRRAATTGSLP